MRKTLLLINVALNTGSTGKIVEGIGALALAEGWNIVVAHGSRYKNSSNLYSIQVSSKVGEYLHYFESSLFDAQGLGSRIETKRFLKKLDQIKPDLVHVHNIHGCFLNYPLLFRYLNARNIPVVWTLHDCWAMTGHCVHFERTNCDKWKSLCEKCPQKRDFPSSYLFDMSKRNFMLKRELLSQLDNLHITTVSKWLADVAKESFLKSLPIHVIPNGIQTSLFQNTSSDIVKQLNVSGKKILLAVASGFGERKGLYDYCRLSEILTDKYQLILVGVSEEDKKQLPSNIITLSKTDSQLELVKLYSAADVLLSLSYEETFGLTILEAMSCGTPAVVYANTAQPELITSCTGTVVPTGDIAAVVVAVDSICSQGKGKYSSNCKSFAENYEQTKIYRDYINLYTSILSKN